MMNVVAAQRANVFTRTTTSPDSVPWLGRCVQPAGNAAQKPECLTELVSPDRYRVVRYERPVGVVDRDDQPGRGTCRQSTCDTAFGVDPVRPCRAGSRRAFSAHRRHRAERLRGAGRRPGPAGGRRRVARITPTSCWSTLCRRWSTPPAANRRRRPRSPFRRTGERRRCGRCATRCGPTRRLAPNGMPARLISDAVASLTALHANPGLSPHGVVALLDFGGGGTSITLADAASAFEPIEDTTRYTEFSGDLIDQALLNHVLDGIANAGGVDPAGTAAVGSLTRLREECRNAKERLSAETVTELIVELPGYRSGIRVTRTELESLIAQPLDGVLTRTGKCVGAQQDQLVEHLCGGHHRWWCQHSVDHPATFRALAGAGGDDTSAGAGRRRGRRVVRRLRFGGRRENRGGAGAAGGCSRSGRRAGVGDVPRARPGPRTTTPPTTSCRTPAICTTRTGRPLVRRCSTYRRPSRSRSRGRRGNRLPQLVFGLAAVVAVVAVGGVAVALTSATDSTKATEPPQTATSAPGPTSAAPPPSTARRLSRPSRSPASRHRLRRPAPTTTVPPPTTTYVTTTTTAPRPPQRRPRQRRQQRPPQRPRPRHTTTPRQPPQHTTTTTPPMTTTYINVPFVPVPIPIQVPQNQYQAPQNQYQPPQYQYPQPPQLP